ncbi:type II secretion system F family protein [Patescibacteria group bacterium]|nr:type II secretion system F family protein [Patescibacteria group bacterium]MCG2702692.1 type II secretion system F family protein [Candidatus Parcubacteria bacterium]MBU4265307.1 type II secretion system F family protein [Patescibacteria group bacterium]MBU4389992.1 type II secretion system F family protein [Patescibacteria group bacterium]MBU4430919.1 type II secretion system F family protein [Patescibacteria group bacterium]
MKRFFYKAKDWHGKMIKGNLEAVDEKAVVEMIKDSGLVPLLVKESKRSVFDEFLTKIFGKVGLKQITSFTRQLSTMMTAGLPLTDALSLLKVQMRGEKMFFDVLDDCLEKVRAGQSLGFSMEKYSKIFGEAYVASIKAGEKGGVLDEVLLKLAKSLENEYEFRGKVKGAMVYPVIVIIGMIIVVFIMMIFVIPKLMDLYADFGSEMPFITRALMFVSSVMVRLWFLFPLIPLLFYIVNKFGNKFEKFRLKKDGMLLKLPILGELMAKTIIANTCRTLSMLLTAGISLISGLKIVSSVASNELFGQAYRKIANRVEKGFSVADSFADHEIFPMIVNQMVTTGEATGKLDEVLMRISDYFSTEAEQSVKSLTSAIEPLIMIMLGIGVAFLVVAVIMPIYDLTSQF